MVVTRILGLVAGCGFCGALARSGEARLRQDSWAARAMVRLLLFATAQSLVILVAGLAGALSFWPLAGASALGWAILRLPGMRPAPASPGSAPLPGGLRRPEAVLAGSLALLGLASLVLKSFLCPPSTGDALSYHLPKIAQWIQSGRFVWGLNHDPRVWFSAGFELIETWWVVFLHHDALIEWGGLEMLLLAVLSVAALSEAFGAAPALAGLVYGFIPAVLLGATSCGNDLAVAALLLCAYALVARGAPRALQALPLCLAVGVKATGAFGALGVLAFAWGAPRPARVPRALAAGLVAAGVGLALFWYGRNWIVAGHPLYPFRGSHGEFTWSPQQGGVDLESLQQTLQALPRRMVDPYPFESQIPLQTGWGWAILPLGVPALLLGLRLDPRFRRLAASFALGAAATLSCVWFQDTNLRFLLWLPALGAIGLARPRGRLWAGAALAACTINFAATLFPLEIRRAEHLRPPQRLPADTPVACVFSDMAMTYRLYNHDFSRRVVYPRSLEELRRSGAKVVYLASDPGWAAPIRRWPALAEDYYEIR